jgi:hypothetical protein
MAVKYDPNNVLIDELLEVYLTEPYIYTGLLHIWKNENEEEILIKPFKDFNLGMIVKKIYS